MGVVLTSKTGFGHIRKDVVTRMTASIIIKCINSFELTEVGITGD